MLTKESGSAQGFCPLHSFSSLTSLSVLDLCGGKKNKIAAIRARSTPARHVKCPEKTLLLHGSIEITAGLTFGSKGPRPGTPSVKTP